MLPAASFNRFSRYVTANWLLSSAIVLLQSIVNTINKENCFCFSISVKKFPTQQDGLLLFRFKIYINLSFLPECYLLPTFHTNLDAWLRPWTHSWWMHARSAWQLPITHVSPRLHRRENPQQQSNPCPSPQTKSQKAQRRIIQPVNEKNSDAIDCLCCRGNSACAPSLWLEKK